MKIAFWNALNLLQTQFENGTWSIFRSCHYNLWLVQGNKKTYLLKNNRINYSRCMWLFQKVWRKISRLWKIRTPTCYSSCHELNLVLIFFCFFFPCEEQSQLADADWLQFCFDRLKSLFIKCLNKEEGYNEYVLWLHKTFWNAVNFTFCVDVLTKIRGAFLIWNISPKNGRL